MTITRKQIKRMRSHGRMLIDAELEDMILATYGVEPDGREYTEQGLYEQFRKLVGPYNHKHPDLDLVATPPWAGNRSTAPVPMSDSRGAKISK